MKTTLALLILCVASSLQAGAAKAPAAIQPAPGDGNVIFGEHSRRDDSSYSSLGYMHALNNDLSLGGLFVRAFTGVGQYEYHRDGNQLPDNDITGTLFDADLGLGHRHVTQHLTLGAFVGLHVRDRNLDAIDPTNEVGTDWGARFGLDATGHCNGFYYSAIGQISSVEWSVWTRGRLGYQFGSVTVGPEFIYLNDAMFSERRFGGFITWQACPHLALTGAMGSADYGSSGSVGIGQAGNTPYGSLSFVFTF